LFDRAVVWLANDRVLLPGIMTLARMVPAVGSEDNDRLRAVLYETVPYELRTKMVRLAGGAGKEAGAGAGAAAVGPNAGVSWCTARGTGRGWRISANCA
jgi:hypothetical protein